jgi:hypothetical protein
LGTYLEICCGISFSAIVTGFSFFWGASISGNVRPFQADLIFGNSQKSFRAKSGEQGGCSISVTDLWVRNFSTESALWAGALQWLTIQKLTPNSGHFLLTVSRNRFKITT